MLENFLKITGLALADAVNPCAMAVLSMVLISILIEHPKERKKVLQAGLAFSLSIYLGYLIYGGVIVQFFKTFELFLRLNSIYIYKGLAIFAIGIGLLNIKDAINYKAGSFATEMPLFLRPKVKKLIKKITSPGGAFTIGFIVTLFLLPCTMGPLVIASGILAELSLFNAILWLLYYNVLFVLPMVAITFIIYLGLKKVNEISGWKEKNIKKLHLVAGILLLLMGVAIFNGWL